MLFGQLKEVGITVPAEIPRKVMMPFKFDPWMFVPGDPTAQVNIPGVVPARGVENIQDEEFYGKRVGTGAGCVSAEKAQEACWLCMEDFLLRVGLCAREWDLHESHGLWGVTTSFFILGEDGEYRDHPNIANAGTGPLMDKLKIGVTRDATGPHSLPFGFTVELVGTAFLLRRESDYWEMREEINSRRRSN